MKSVVICGSRRFKKGIGDLIVYLRSRGVVVLTPILFELTDEDKCVSQTVQYLYRCGLTLHHFNQIEKADVCFIYNEGGYIGISTTLEMGFAAACKLPIYALAEDTADPTRAVLIDGVVSDPKQLLAKLC